MYTDVYCTVKQAEPRVPPHAGLVRTLTTTACQPIEADILSMHATCQFCGPLQVGPRVAANAESFAAGEPADRRTYPAASYRHARMQRVPGADGSRT